jgi:hypothetical protein
MAFCVSPVSVSHQPRAPMRAVGWHRFQSLRHDVFNLFIRDLARRTDSWFIQQPIQPKLSKPFPPLTDRRTRNTQLPRHLRIAHSQSATQHDPSSHCHGLCRLRPSRDHGQFPAIFIGDFERLLGSARAHIQVCRPIQDVCNVFIAQNSSSGLHLPRTAGGGSDREGLLSANLWI